MISHNYHTHTARCRHAEGEDEQYVQAAIAAGIKTLGFSDHTPYPGFPEGYYSSYRMFPGETEGYFTSVRSLRDKYKGEAEILCGLEVEYFPALFDGLLDMLAPFHPDYFILGQHCTKNEYDGLYSSEPCGDEILAEYCRQTIAGLRTGRFSCLAHPDVINYEGSDETFRHEMTEVCRVAREMKIPLEFNLCGLKYRRNYPGERFFALAAEMGCEVIIGVDAHSPDDLRSIERIECAEKILKGLGITPLEALTLREPLYDR